MHVESSHVEYLLAKTRDLTQNLCSSTLNFVLFLQIFVTIRTHESSGLSTFRYVLFCAILRNFANSVT